MSINLSVIHYLHAKAVAGGDPMAAKSYAKDKVWFDDRAKRMLEKAAIGSGALGADVDFMAAGQAFIHQTRARSILGKIQAISGFRRIPFETRVLAQQSVPIASWRQEGMAIAMSAIDFEGTTIMQPLSLGAIIPMTLELLKGTGAAFEAAIGQEIARAIAEQEASSFIDPENAGLEGVSPASVTNGIDPVTPDGTGTQDAVRALLQAFQGDKESAVFVTTPDIGSDLFADGYLNAGARGGDVAGIPLVTGRGVPAGLLALIDPQAITLSDNGVLLDISTEATVTDTDGVTSSLWQQNLAGLKSVRILNWEREIPGSVVYCTL